MKSVLYLIQARSKLPDMYSCLRRRNFILLSYKHKSADTTIFAPNTTYAEGRNVLYEHVRRHNLLYDYYVFLDEDIIFFPTHQLVKYPLNYCINFAVNIIIRIPVLLSVLKKLFFCIQDFAYTSLEESMEFNYPILTPLYSTFFMQRTLLLPWTNQTNDIYDVTYLALSREAFFADTILPLSTTYDSESWILSPYIQFLRANHFYRRRILRNNAFYVCNYLHSPYPNTGFTKTMRIHVYNETCENLGVERIHLWEYERVGSEKLRCAHKIRHYRSLQIMIYGFFMLACPIVFPYMFIKFVNGNFPRLISLKDGLFEE